MTHELLISRHFHRYLPQTGSITGLRLLLLFNQVDQEVMAIIISCFVVVHLLPQLFFHLKSAIVSQSAGWSGLCPGCVHNFVAAAPRGRLLSNCCEVINRRR